MCWALGMCYGVLLIIILWDRYYCTIFQIKKQRLTQALCEGQAACQVGSNPCQLDMLVTLNACWRSGICCVHHWSVWLELDCPLKFLIDEYPLMNCLWLLSKRSGASLLSDDFLLICAAETPSLCCKKHPPFCISIYPWGPQGQEPCPSLSTESRILLGTL